MDIVDKHFNLILHKYNLNHDYNKWLYTSSLSALTTEMVYVCMILFSILLERNPKNTTKYVLIIFSVLASNIIIERLSSKYLVNITKKFKIANYAYSNELLTKLDKKQLLDLDLSNYSITIEGMNKEFDSYIENKKFKTDYIILFISLIIIAILNKNPIIIMSGIVYSVTLYQLNKKKNIDIIQNEPTINALIQNSKNSIMNNNNNNKYHSDKINNLYNSFANLTTQNNYMIFYANILTFILL